MMYMDDAIRATVELMQTDALAGYNAYNIAAINFTPAELAAKIREKLPEFSMHYSPDFRQAIADSWPESIDDSLARADWGWKPEFDLDRMTEHMIENLQ